MKKERNNTSLSDLLPKIRPKSYNFMSNYDVVFKKNIIKPAKEEIAKNSEISKINLFEKTSSPANFPNRRKNNTFLRDLWKLFSKNKTTSMNATTTATTSTVTSTITTTTTATATATTTNDNSDKMITCSQDNRVMQNGMEDLNDSEIQLRKKSKSWSHYEAQKIFQNYRKSPESKYGRKYFYSIIRTLRKNGSATFMNQIADENTENKNTVCSKEFSTGRFSRRWKSDQSICTDSLYKPSKFEKMIIENKKKQKNEMDDSISILVSNNKNNPALIYNRVKKLKVYGYFCHVRLSPTYAILHGYTKSLKLKICLIYKDIQQIRLIYANKKLEQIMVKMVRRKVRFTTNEHIFNDFYQLWHNVTLSTINKRKYALNENDMQRRQRQKLMQKSDNDLITADNDNDDMDKLHSASNEVLSETTCATTSSAISLSSLMTMADTPDSEFSTDDNDNVEKCQRNNSSNTTDNIEVEVQCQCQSHLGRILLDEVYPLTTGQLFATFFSATPWYHNLREITNKTAHGKLLNAVTDYMATSWMIKNSAVPTVTTRTVTYNMSLNNALGPKSTSVTEKQTCYTFHDTDDGFSVVKEIQNAGIPYADNFMIQCTYCVIRAGSKHSRLLVHGGMVQKKSIWGIVKGIIEKSTYNGLETHYMALKETLKLLCEESNELKQTTVSESEASNSIINNLLPNKLLNGNYISSKGRSLGKHNASTIVHYQTVMLKPIINSAETMNVATAMTDNNRICDNAAGITGRITNDAQTQTLNYFIHNKTISYSNKFILILFFILFGLQLFTLLKVSYISNFNCIDTNANSAFTKDILRQNDLSLNTKTLEQLSLTSKNTIFKNDL